MSEPKNHHYVPKVYLKEFSNSFKQFFQKIKKHGNITIKSISQVCYEEYYFKLHKEDNLFLTKFKDHNYIEKNVFKKQENQYPKLLKKITFPSLSLISISKLDASAFLETLITIKRRNPTYRKVIIEDFKKMVTSDKFRAQAEQGFEISRKIDKIDPELFFENYVKESTTNVEKQSDFYLQVFLDQENRTTENTVQLLMKYRIYVYHAPFGIEYITSDNPGYTLMQDGRLFSFGAFGMPFTFIFPLTPKCCLLIKYTHQEEDKFNLNKNIHVVHASKQFVETVNEGTKIIALDKIFAYSKSVLEDMNH